MNKPQRPQLPTLLLMPEVVRDSLIEYLLTKPMNEVEVAVNTLRKLQAADIIPRKRSKGVQPNMPPAAFEKIEE